MSEHMKCLKTFTKLPHNIQAYLHIFNLLISYDNHSQIQALIITYFQFSPFLPDNISQIQALIITCF